MKTPKRKIKFIIAILAIIVFTWILLWIGIVIRDGFKKLPRPDCQFMIPAYQHQLEKKVEKLMEDNSGKWEDYDSGWEDALSNVLNLIK